jgi:hypothetical protein
MNRSHILIFSLLFYIILSENLFIPFKTRINLDEMNTDNVMEMLINNQITVDFLVGSNNQAIEMNLKIQNASTYILSYTCPENEYAIKFYDNESTTINVIDENARYYMHGFAYATHVNDTAIILLKDGKKSNIIDLRFMLATKLDYNTQKNVSGVIGLILTNEHKITKDTDFINQMEENKIVDAKIFTLDYKDFYNGIFYVGKYYHEYNKNYNKNDLIKLNAGRTSSTYKSWEMEINKVLSGNEEVQGNTYLQLFYELGIIGAPIQYYNHTKNNFFKEYLEKGICEEKKGIETAALFQRYEYIVCETKDFKVESFPDLKFFTAENEYNYSLSYDKLFYEFKNKTYFLVIHPLLSITYEYWYIGKPMFLKYKFFFDKDSKTIGFYNVNETDQDQDEEKEKEKDDNDKNGNNNNENNNGKEKNDMTILYVIIIIVLILVIIGILFYFIRRIMKSRKIRANELEEDVDYTPYKENDVNKDENIN